MDHPRNNGLSPGRTGFGFKLVCMEFMVDKVVQRYVLVQVLLFLLLLDIINIIILNTHSSIIDGI